MSTFDIGLSPTMGIIANMGGTEVVASKGTPNLGEMQMDNKAANDGTKGLEETLETHEVIEINKFTERKEWIESKIALLESMPPIEVFACVDLFESLSAGIPPGLPSRDELNRWLDEHDKLEKETDIFDTGDMNKLKKLTKAATQRNLSSEDTDLIELTLNTLLALDKLLHLLRDRSESLELLSLRLTWEEQRSLAWQERRLVLEDLQTFLTTRARWSVDTYDPISAISSDTRYPSPSPSPSTVGKRRDSVTSISSDASMVSAGFLSRTARFKLAEQLSHDAAILASRLTALNHTKVAAAGKTLDKLIDNSRKPVPDEILDEQDRLEDKAVKELEIVGKFTMAVVMQWKRADEYYNDIIKDQVSAHSLLGELRDANAQQPTPKLCAAFTSRAQALMKRLTLKPDPTLSKSSFPRPSHPLFPDQTASNDLIAKALSSELAEAMKLVHQSEAAVRDYQRRLEVVKHAETLQSRIRDILEQLEQVHDKILHGFNQVDGQKSCLPPNTHTVACLDPVHHNSFLAMFPSYCQTCASLDTEAKTCMIDAEVTLFELKALPGIDESFIAELTTLMERLSHKQNTFQQIRQNVIDSVERLKEARYLWNSLDEIFEVVQDIQSQVIDNLELQRWRTSFSKNNTAPGTPVPDSPQSRPMGLPSLSPDHLSNELHTLTKKLSDKIEPNLCKLSSSLETLLSSHLRLSFEGVVKGIRNALESISLWKDILKQAAEMSALVTGASELGGKVDEILSEMDDKRQVILEHDLSDDEMVRMKADLSARISTLQGTVQIFQDSMASRIPLLGYNNGESRNLCQLESYPKPPPSIDNSPKKLNRLKVISDPVPPLDLSVCNMEIRNEVNAIAMHLSGSIQSVLKSLSHVHIATLAKTTDKYANEVAHVLDSADAAISQMNARLTSIQACEVVGFDDIDQRAIQLTLVLDDIDRFAEVHRAKINGLIRQLRDSTEDLQNAPGSQESSIHDLLVLHRSKTANNLAQRSEECDDSIRLLRSHVMDLQADTSDRRDRENKELVQLAGKRQQEIEKQELEITEEEHLDEVREMQPTTPEEDVFGRRLVPSSCSDAPIPAEAQAIRSQVRSLRNRLLSLSITARAIPNSASSGIPTFEEATQVQTSFDAIVREMSSLPEGVDEPVTNAELLSFRSELLSCRPLVKKVLCLGKISDRITTCDNAFSDLLEHVDTYPAAPLPKQLASSHVSDPCLPCEEQLKSRLDYCSGAVEELREDCREIKDDTRVDVELKRIDQTWSELEVMCTDRLDGTRSRPASSISSAGQSSAGSTHLSIYKKAKPSLSGKGPRPNTKEQRRAVSGAREILRSPSHLSTRSVSGPTGPSSLYNQTFASRQRTTSLASVQPFHLNGFKRPVSPNLLTKRRGVSPTFSDVSSRSMVSTPSRSTWARAPRQSFGTVPRNFQSNITPRRKPYVANPKSKLDIAVGDVVNNFRLPVTVQAVSDGWRDQSGKYWIGDIEPKLCFCRILRSQTVMVRVGGGWCELSKFLKSHFADLLADLPPSPPRKEERWINATTVLSSMEGRLDGAVKEPTTPVIMRAPLPSLQLSTPSGTSPQSLRTNSSQSGSPNLTPFQYLRRAEPNFNPATPTKLSKSNKTNAMLSTVTPSKPSVWRP